MRNVFAALLISAFAFPGCAARSAAIHAPRRAEAVDEQRGGQDPPELWHAYARKLPLGSTVMIRTTAGDRFNATLLLVDDTGITVKPKGLEPALILHVAFDRLDQLKMQAQGQGPGSRAAAIGTGIGVGAGVFFGLLGLLFAVAGD
jgi:hypothetical protein